MEVDKKSSRENEELKSHTIDKVFEDDDKPLPYSDELLKKLNIPKYNDKKRTRTGDSRPNR